MNKKLFLGMFVAATMLFATSCSDDALDATQSGKKATVSFSLGVEDGVQSRVISDGQGAKRLIYRVFDENGNPISETLGKTTETVSEYPHIVNLVLAKGQTYKVAFWAQNEECTAYTIDENMNLSINYAGVNNDETRDAFYKTVKFTVTGNATMDVVLRRPFAQLNVGVTDKDWEAAVASGVKVEKSKVEISNVASTMNLVDGTVGGEKSLTYSLAAIPTQKLTVNETEYNYLSMCYFLVDAAPEGTEKAALNHVKFTFDSDAKDIVLEDGLNNVPVQRNWRTNLIGQLLTGNIDFKIVIDEDFDGEYNGEGNGDNPEQWVTQIAEGVSYDETTKTFIISNTEGLKWIAKQSNAETKHGLIETSDDGGCFVGQTVKIVQNIDLAGEDWTPIGSTPENVFLGTFDGGNNTISNLTVNHDENSGLFGNVNGIVQNVRLADVNVKGSDKVGALAANASGTITNCHVDGGYVGSIVNSEGDNENHVGGLVGNLEGASSKVTDSSANNLIVSANDNLGGLVGTAETGSDVSGNEVYNIELVVNRLATDATGEAENVNDVVGNDPDAGKKNSVSNVITTVLENENGVIRISDAAELLVWETTDYASGEASDGIIVQLTEDIDLTGVTTFTPIASDEAFKGTFDGNDKVIKNLKHNNGEVDQSNTPFALFTTLEDATVTNLIIEGMEVKHYFGGASFIAVEATGNCVFEDITIRNSKLSESNYDAGAIVATATDGNYTFKNIIIADDVVLAATWGSPDAPMGGIVGWTSLNATYSFKDITISCCMDVFNDYTANYRYGNYRYCGMIIGYWPATTVIDGANCPDLSKGNVSFDNVIVNYGKWMNYHYCKDDGEPKWKRVEPGYVYGGKNDHSNCAENHRKLMPFDQLVGGGQNVKGLQTINGVEVNYPASDAD